MLDFDEGAPVDPDARLKGEILGSLSTWTADYKLERLELPWAIAQALLQHVNRTQPLDVYIEFLEKLAEIAGDQAHDLRKVIGDDSRKRMH